VREPTSPDQKWAWWEAAVDGQNPPVCEDEPQVGFYAVRKFQYGQWARGPMVPARIWIEPGEIDPETGELLSDERLCAEIDGRRVDPWRHWTWIAKRPISQTEWEWLKALSPLLPTRVPPKRRAV
jgi:hypothetical protein